MCARFQGCFQSIVWSQNACWIECDSGVVSLQETAWLLLRGDYCCVVMNTVRDLTKGCDTSHETLEQQYNPLWSLHQSPFSWEEMFCLVLRCIWMWEAKIASPILHSGSEEFVTLKQPDRQSFWLLLGNGELMPRLAVGGRFRWTVADSWIGRFMSRIPISTIEDALDSRGWFAQLCPLKTGSWSLVFMKYWKDITSCTRTEVKACS